MERSSASGRRSSSQTAAMPVMPPPATQSVFIDEVHSLNLWFINPRLLSSEPEGARGRFVAMGKQPASYLYYKDVNREPLA